MNRLDRKWLLALVAVVVCLATVTALVIWNRESVASESDCQVVAELAHEWSESAEQDQAGGDPAAGLARKVRDATRAVDDPKLKDTLNTWADGFDTFAEALRTNTDSDPRLVEAANLIYGTADELRQACPEAFPADTR